MTKYILGEKVQFLGYTSNMHNEFGKVVNIDDSKPIVLYILKFGHELTSHRFIYIADVRESQMKKEKEMIKPEDIICHPNDKRVSALIGKKVYVSDSLIDFEDIPSLNVRELLGIRTSNSYPFRTSFCGERFIAPYVEPVKQYRWFESYDSNELRDTLGKDVKYRLNVQTRTRRVVKYTEGLHGYAVIELDSGKQLTAKELFDNYMFIDGGVCGVEI